MIDIVSSNVIHSVDIQHRGNKVILNLFMLLGLYGLLVGQQDITAGTASKMCCSFYLYITNPIKQVIGCWIIIWGNLPATLVHVVCYLSTVVYISDRENEYIICIDAYLIYRNPFQFETDIHIVFLLFTVT